MEYLNSKRIAKKYNFSPKKKFGQNFLVKKEIVKKIISGADIKKNEIIIEIGPGLGVITREIAKDAKTFIVIEKDRELAKILKEEIRRFNSVKVINKDVLKMKNFLHHFSADNKRYKVIANLPFYASIPIIKIFLGLRNKPKKIVVILQKELAQRIIAKPPKTNSLAVFFQFYASIKIICYVPKNSFWPEPEVDGAIISLTPKKGNIDEKLLEIVKDGFSQPRKKLINNLLKKNMAKKENLLIAFKKARIDPSQRAESLSLNDWLKLSEMLK